MRGGGEVGEGGSVGSRTGAWDLNANCQWLLLGALTVGLNATLRSAELGSTLLLPSQPSPELLRAEGM